MMRRFDSFREMLAAQGRENIAFGYFEEDARRQLTYGEVLERIDAYPLPAEDVIGVFCDNSILSVITIFALAGKKQLVLLNPADEPRILDAEIRAAHVSKLVGQGPEEYEAPPLVPGSVGTADILFFTSGTTSQNKAVVLDQQRLCSAAFNGGS